MKRRYIIILFLVIGIAFPGMLTATGHYTSTNYHRDNGFPGNNVYYIYQDRQEYIWMATENGLVSFNGYEFKTYTTKDGLPDNEVLSINEDNAGRLWLTMFANEICYLWKGKVYNKHNDSLLHKLSFHLLPKGIEFDRWGNIWISEDLTYVFISPKGQIKYIDRIGNERLVRSTSMTITDEGVLIFVNELNGKVYCYNKNHFEFMGEIPKYLKDFQPYPKLAYTAIQELGWTPIERFMERLAKGKNMYWELKGLHTINFFRKLSPKMLGMGTTNGFYLKNIQTGKMVDSFLQNYNVLSGMIAKDSSLWFGTLGSGVFHFSRSFIKSIPADKNTRPIRFIKAQNNGLHFIAGEDTLAEVQFNTQQRSEVVDQKKLNGLNVHRVYTYIGQDHMDNWITCGTGIAKYSNLDLLPIQKYYYLICKATIEEGDTSLLMGAVQGIFRLNKDKFMITDQLYDKRVTSLAKIDNTVYAGTLTGLVACYPGKKTVALFQQYPLLNTHITALCADDNKLLWVANNQAVLTGIYRGRVVSSIDEDKGLVCNSISTLTADRDFLWVGTDNGLFVFNKNRPYNIIRHLSTADGLKSNQITYLNIADRRVYIGTGKGLNYSEISEITPLISKPAFIVTGIRDGEKDISISDVIELKNKTLKIGFDVIDHSGITRPKYAYRLKDGNWINIENKDLYFPTIPYGDFTVQIKAQSPNWNAPKIIVLRFNHASPFYLSNWFILLAGMALMGMIGILVWLFTRKRRRKEQEQLLMQKNLLQLEQMALQGQMNPHFIFNCITAIRQYYNKGNTEKANKFVDDFSNLIRTTFEMATQTFTPLEKELAYLRQYLEIEKERFSHSFDFSITKNIQSPGESIFVPTMLLQPFVENAVRHGVRHLPDGQGKIGICVVEKGENITITIQDNGIGRLKTLQMKQTSFTAAPVTSTKVNKKRIDILNKLFDEKVSLNTSDVLNDKGAVTGTIVVISYPSDIYVSR